MTTSNHSIRISSRQSFKVAQSGVALVVALILLVVMTLVGLSGLRNVTLEERMTANTFDRSISFQAAEAALKDAEEEVESLAGTPAMEPAAGTPCNAVNGVCGVPIDAAVQLWLDNTTPWFNSTTLDNGGVAITPQYIIEFLGNTFVCDAGNPAAGTNCARYRITARSNAGADRSVVMLQSIYAPL